MKCVVSRSPLQALRGSHVPGGSDLRRRLIRPAVTDHGIQHCTAPALQDYRRRMVSAALPRPALSHAGCGRPVRAGSAAQQAVSHGDGSGWPESPHGSEDAAWPGAPAGRTVQSTGHPVSLLTGSGTAEEHGRGARAEAMVVRLQLGTSLKEIEQLMLHTGCATARPVERIEKERPECPHGRTALCRSVSGLAVISAGSLQAWWRTGPGARSCGSSVMSRRPRDSARGDGQPGSAQASGQDARGVHS